MKEKIEVKDDENAALAATPENEAGCCRVESVVSIDERGQMVLPKEVREAANIKPGDKLAVVSWLKGDEVCCITLIKADLLTGMVKSFLGPVMKDVI